MKANELILIVEDDDAISKLLTISLSEYGYKTRRANDLAMAKREFISYNPMLIILDLGLPDGDGKELIKMIRKESKTSIIVLSARSDEKEIIAALDLGADDYVTKPFSTSELLARVRSTLRRVHHDVSHEILTCKDLCIDFTKKEVTLKTDTRVFNRPPKPAKDHPWNRSWKDWMPSRQRRVSAY